MSKKSEQNSNVYVLKSLAKTSEVIELHEAQMGDFEELTPPNNNYDYVREICQWYEEDELVGSDDMAAVTFMASYVFNDLAKFVLWSRTQSTSFTLEDIDETINEFREDNGFVNAFFEFYPVKLPDFYRIGFQAGMWLSVDDEDIYFAED